MILLAATAGAAPTSPTPRVVIHPIEWIVSENTGQNYWAYVAPDGDTLTFSRTTDGRTYDLLVTNRLGRTPRPFLSSRPAASLTRGYWSRSHGRLAFIGSERDDVRPALYVSDATGRNVERVPIQGGLRRVMYPSWLPDGKSVVVVDFGAAGGGRLYRLDLASGASEALTNPAELLAGMPSVSPDGQTIAFAGQLNRGQVYDQMQNRIWVMPSRGGQPQEISAGLGRQPDWSPDGRWLAFASARSDRDGRQAVFIVDRTGADLIQLTTHAVDAQHPVWSPDGSWLLFSAESPERKGVYGLARIVLAKLPR